MMLPGGDTAYLAGDHLIPMGEWYGLDGGGGVR